MIVIADQSKRVETLGRFPLPIEVVPFGLGATRRTIEAATAALGCPGPALLRRSQDGHASRSERPVELFRHDGYVL